MVLLEWIHLSVVYTQLLWVTGFYRVFFSFFSFQPWLPIQLPGFFFYRVSNDCWWDWSGWGGEEIPSPTPPLSSFPSENRISFPFFSGYHGNSMGLASLNGFYRISPDGHAGGGGAHISIISIKDKHFSIHRKELPWKLKNKWNRPKKLTAPSLITWPLVAIW